jgi:peptide-methionine (S)-S-oxide reductase
MIFDKLFGGGGGGYAAKIDYTAIPYPVPELASAALEGKAPEQMERNGKTYKLATFAGGCFWGLELAYQRVPGVEYTGVGYTQGPETEPTYSAVCAGATGHTEAIIVLYDPNECSYETLLDAFFSRVDPLTVNGQGNDRGKQYRTGVYYHSKEQEDIAKARFALEQEKYSGRKIASECLKAEPFWPAEKYHQQYLEKGGRSNSPQSAQKGSTDTIRCYG